MKKLAILLLFFLMTGCGGGASMGTETTGAPSLARENSGGNVNEIYGNALPANAFLSAGSGYNYFPGKPVPFAQTSGKIVGAFLPNYSMSSGYNISTVTANNLTHLVYAFVFICGPDQNAESASVCVGKKDFELAVGNTVNTHYTQLQDVKNRSPQLKLMASIGGPSGGKPYYHLAGDPAKRSVFVNSVVSFLNTYPAYDGIDVDWEYPTAGTLGKPGDSQAYVDLLNDLRTALAQLGATNGRQYILSSSVETGSYVVNKVNYQAAQQYVDFFFVMAYDYYGPWSSVIGHHTPLYPAKTTRGVQTLINVGVSPSKLVHGAATYSRGWGSCTDSTDPTLGTGNANYNGKDGIETYGWLAANLIDSSGNGKNGYQVNYDSNLHAYSLWNPTSRTYIGYDDPRAVAEKAQYAVSNGLAGVFAWQLSHDNGDIFSAMNYGIGNRAPFAVRTSANLLDETEKQKFFQFALENRINHLYFNSSLQLQTQQSLLAQLIADAKARGIDVTLLVGSSQWALETNHQKAVDIALLAANFTRDLTAQGKPAPVGIQLDVRPYLLAEWKANYAVTATQFLQMLKKVRDNVYSTIPSGALPVGIDVAYWYDDPLYRLTYGGQTRPLSEFTIDATDYTVILDYRNTADRIVSSAASELEYAAASGKKVRVGVQIRCPAADDTLCGRQTMLDSVDQASSSFRVKPAFRGFVMTNYESWLNTP